MITSRYDTISDSGLWGLLYHTGYLTVQTYAESSLVRDRIALLIQAHLSAVYIYLPNSKRGSNFGVAKLGGGLLEHNHSPSLSFGCVRRHR